MKALVVNAAGRSFDLEDVDVAAPIGREVLIDVQASGLCHTDRYLGMRSLVSSPKLAQMSHNSASAITSLAR